MQEPKLDGNGSLANPVEHVTTPETGHIDRDSENRSDVVATVATVAVVGIVAAAFEAALLPGIVLGVAAVWLPQHFPKMGAALNPLFRTTVRGAYKIRQKTQEMMAEAHEQVQDIVAEVDAEGTLKASKVPVA
jgi:Protein of unknown function (DUF5132)